MTRIRRLLLALLLSATASTGARATDGDQAWAALKDGAVVLVRHATAPGIGDPANFRLGDCATQRNLDDTGRKEAARIGRSFAAHGVVVGRVLSSQWCRTRETAELAFPGRVVEAPIFNSFFANVADDPKQTAAARALLSQWKGPGVLVVVTHQVNITALTGIVPGSGEAVVVRADGEDLKLIGRLAPAHDAR